MPHSKQYDMMLAMTESPANTLCKACGLCCTGHIFAWTKLRSPELDSIQALGVPVFREPERRGFNQPCPLWQGVCTVYDTPNYPRFCHTYKCKLLKELLAETISLDNALPVIEQTHNLIQEVTALLPPSANPNFSERVLDQLEHPNTPTELHSAIENLLVVYKSRFGVTA